MGKLSLPIEELNLGRFFAALGTQPTPYMGARWSAPRTLFHLVDELRLGAVPLETIRELVMDPEFVKIGGNLQIEPYIGAAFKFSEDYERNIVAGLAQMFDKWPDDGADSYPIAPFEDPQTVEAARLEISKALDQLHECVNNAYNCFGTGSAVYMPHDQPYGALWEATIDQTVRAVESLKESLNYPLYHIEEMRQLVRKLEAQKEMRP